MLQNSKIHHRYFKVGSVWHIKTKSDLITGYYQISHKGSKGKRVLQKIAPQPTRLDDGTPRVIHSWCKEMITAKYWTFTPITDSSSVDTIKILYGNS